MLSISPLSAEVAALREGLAGDVVLPGDAGWDAARQAWNLAADQRPALVALPECAADVQALVDFSRTRGLRVAMQGTGHNAVPMGPLDDTVLVKTERMRGVEIDERNCVARVEAGALWIDVTAPASEAGLAPLAGSSPDVGVVGYTLGGGLSWLGRKYGLAANRLLSAEVVTADGRLVHASRHENPELFWALRGGGGNFGAVVAIEFELIPMRSVYAGMMLFPWDRAREILQAWREWTATVPESVTTSARIMQFPPMEELPPFLRGRTVAVVDGAVLGSDAEGERMVAGLRALEPELDTFGRQPAADLARLHMDPEGPSPFASDSRMLGSFPEAAVDAFLEQVGPDATSSLLVAELRQLGGALARPHEGGGVLSHLEGEFVSFAGGIAATPEMGAAAHADATELMTALDPWGNGRQYLNFAEAAVDTRVAYQDSAWTQLAGIRSAVDPHGTFVANHPVPRLYEDGVAAR